MLDSAVLDLQLVSMMSKGLFNLIDSMILCMPLLAYILSRCLSGRSTQTSPRQAYAVADCFLLIGVKFCPFLVLWCWGNQLADFFVSTSLGLSSSSTFNFSCCCYCEVFCSCQQQAVITRSMFYLFLRQTDHSMTGSCRPSEEQEKAALSLASGELA